MKLDEYWSFDALVGTEELEDVQDMNGRHDLLNAQWSDMWAKLLFVDVWAV